MKCNPVIFVVYFNLFGILARTEFPGDDGGWCSHADSSLTDEGPCTIDIWDTSLTYKQFIQGYAYTKPVIIRGLSDNTEFRLMCSKDHLLREFGERRVRLSTANTFSYHKAWSDVLPPFTVDVPFQEFVEYLLKPQSLSALGSETLYFFGDNNFTEWHSLFEKYHSPSYVLPHTRGAYSFGIAGPGTGVPFHWHGPGYSEVIHGRKRWFLYPPNHEPKFHPNRTTLSWVTETYPTLTATQRPLECTIRPGEVLYFPDLWWHATLNLDTSVFISTFLG
ncbi:jmjC domain-containing protein 8 isoform X1 [Brienomyrus brachyistius]|uniref:jmjC domain-containing protein 8 isoform X1 n=1 Tax=Brienomyrus brachyistius TaxID=42636 RepID=UPI0020B42847|nr:jmjC domain-containing protein 8 isoform X1 [Brienomyrus brachyistius]